MPFISQLTFYQRATAVLIIKKSLNLGDILLYS